MNPARMNMARMNKAPMNTASTLREPRLAPVSARVSPVAPLLRSALSAFGIGAALALAACGGGGGAAGTPSPLQPTAHPELVRVEFGRLVDVYGLQQTGAGQTLTLFERDVIVGPDIQDERDGASARRDDEILYDFISADPDTLQPRLFIPRLLGSKEFQDAFDKLDDRLREVAPMAFGQNSPTQPFSVVPRNAAIRLLFSASLGVKDDFFVERNAAGMVTGLRNTEAIQVLQIAGDPNGANPGSVFRPLPVRLVVRSNNLILDPVMLGSEGLQYQTRNNAAGLPESPDSRGANIRIALALEGPLSVPGLRNTAITGSLIGANNSGLRSVIRDFRSGNINDSSSDLSRGFVRDPIPPRLVGEIPMFLERVDPVNEVVQEITVFKNSIAHEIDRGDVFKFVGDNSGVPMGIAEVVADPTDDQGNPGVQHVRVRVRFTPGLQDIDPRRLPGYPADPVAREAWLVQNAPRAVLAAEFSAGGRIDPNTNQQIGDDPRYFISFSPTPLPLVNGSPSQPNENVSPMAGAVIRFTKPVDLATVRPADTFFFGTRNLLDQVAIDEFIQNRPNGTGTPGMDPVSFNVAKYRTPHLIGSRVFDEDGSQTALRLQPSSGFYLDDRMRNPQPTDDFRYWLHLLTGEGGVRDLSGNRVDLQADITERANHITIPFTLDARSNGTRPIFENNLAVYITRRHAERDEDEQPSYYLPNEVSIPSGTTRAEAQPLDDLFGAYVYVNGTLQARPTTRSRKIADNLNQAPVAAQTSPLRWCPEPVAGEPQIASNTSTTPFGQGIQNPLNPYGCRLQTVWREIDLSLSRVDPFEFNLDVEQMYWAPFIGANIRFDEFDRMSLFLGHSERRPEPCVGNFSALATFPDSGLGNNFNDNYLHDIRAQSTERESQPPPFPAYVDQPLAIDSSQSVLEPNNTNRFLPLPTFQKPYFVYRDETVREQGGVIQAGSDLRNGLDVFTPFIISPWLHGQGRRVVQNGQNLDIRTGAWNSGINYLPSNTRTIDRFTGGLVGAIALPLLADFWTYCDSSNLPAGNGYIASGANGWQISITVQSGPTPAFRAYSAGRPPLASGSPSICRGPGDAAWVNATGGYTPAGGVTASRDNSLYWIMIDFLKRASVVTNGFIDIYNPHRVPAGFADTRLGPYFMPAGTPQLPANTLPTFTYEFDPPLTQLPGGTAVVVQFRGATEVDPNPWYWRQWYATLPVIGTALQPTDVNFPLDPFKAGDAGVRKFDDRPSGTAGARNWWTYLYNKTVTGYVEDPNQLMTQSYLGAFAGPNDILTPQHVRYLNWRYLMSNNTDANPPVAPTIDTFTFSYKFERRP